jgi:hypothetical protein
MQKNTKILLGLGLIGLAYYLWQKSKRNQVSSENPNQVSYDEDAPCPEGFVRGPMPCIVPPCPTTCIKKVSTEEEVSKKTDEWLLNYYEKMICGQVRGIPNLYQGQRKLSSETLAFHEAVKKELAKRNLQGKCIDYGMFPPN